ncbi:MAG: hypothetical protein NZ522_04180 [Chitinophagales bacterium]|nr:hypothetical protein [Chitinophagales bacterium]
MELLRLAPNNRLKLIKIPRKLEIIRNPFFKRYEANEFRYLGKMYDVVRKEEFADTTYYYCVPDEHEDKLQKTICSWMRDNFGKEKSSNKRGTLNDIIKLVYLDTCINFSFESELFLKSEISFYTFYNLDPVRSLSTPPPEKLS